MPRIFYSSVDFESNCHFQAHFKAQNRRRGATAERDIVVKRRKTPKALCVVYIRDRWRVNGPRSRTSRPIVVEGRLLRVGYTTKLSNRRTFFKGANTGSCQRMLKRVHRTSTLNHAVQGEVPATSGSSTTQTKYRVPNVTPHTLTGRQTCRLTCPRSASSSPPRREMQPQRVFVEAIVSSSAWVAKCQDWEYGSNWSQWWTAGSVHYRDKASCAWRCQRLDPAWKR